MKNSPSPQKFEQEQVDAIMSDKRSQSEIFDSIVQRMIRGHNIPSDKAPEAARNLIKYFEILMDMPSINNHQEVSEA